MAEAPPGYTPQALHDILPLYIPGDSEAHIQTYNLRQTTSCTQTLSWQDDGSTSPLYQIKNFATGGFMNKKPHMIISKREAQHTVQADPPDALQHNESEPQRLNRIFSIIPRRNSDTQSKPLPNSGQEPQYHLVAEARFEIHSTGTNIIYTSFSLPPREQRLELINSQFQILRTTIGGNNHCWQPFPGNKAVLELLNEVEETVARFIFNTDSVSTNGPGMGRRKSVPAEQEVGELQIVEALAGGDRGKEEVICSAVVAVERARRRAVNIGSQYMGFQTGAACGTLISAL